jgi:hypothetical protein
MDTNLKSDRKGPNTKSLNFEASVISMENIMKASFNGKSSSFDSRQRNINFLAEVVDQSHIINPRFKKTDPISKFIDFPEEFLNQLAMKKVAPQKALKRPLIKGILKLI